MRRDLRTKIAAALVRVTRVRDEQANDFVRQKRRRDDRSLLVELSRERGERRGLHASYVRVVRARDRVAQRRARDERHVGQMRAPGIGIVEDARLALVEAELD